MNISYVLIWKYSSYTDKFKMI